MMMMMRTLRYILVSINLYLFNTNVNYIYQNFIKGTRPWHNTPLFIVYLFVQGERFTVKLDKGPRGFGFSLVAAPTFSSDVSEVLLHNYFYNYFLAFITPPQNVPGTQ